MTAVVWKDGQKVLELAEDISANGLPGRAWKLTCEGEDTRKIKIKAMQRYPRKTNIF